MKKLLLSLGAIAAVVTPIASVVACGQPAPKHVDLDKSTVEGMLQQMHETIVGMVTGGNPAAGIAVDDGTVTEKDGNFEVTFTITTDSTTNELKVIVTPKGKINDIITPEGISLKPEEKAALEKLMTGATEQTTGTTDIETEIIISDYDSEIVKGMDHKAPAELVNGQAPDNAKYNTEAEAFLAEYEVKAANAAFKVLNPPMTLTITKADYAKLEFTDGTTLTANNIDELGLPKDNLDRLKSLIAGKVKVTINKDLDDQLAIFIQKSTMTQSDAIGQINWWENKTGIQFATA